MKKVTKAVLFSVFVFPGVGHIFLKRYKTGVVLASIAFSGLWYVVSNAVERAVQITEKIQSGELQMDTETITELISKQSAGTETQLIDLATMAIIICWLVGIIDSYRVGRNQDKTV